MANFHLNTRKITFYTEGIKESYKPVIPVLKKYPPQQITELTSLLPEQCQGGDSQLKTLNPPRHKQYISGSVGPLHVFRLVPFKKEAETPT